MTLYLFGTYPEVDQISTSALLHAIVYLSSLRSNLFFISVHCQQKAIKEAYHVMCNKCAGEKNICAKCLESREIVPTSIKSEKEIVQEKVNLERLLSSMTERERRSYLRQMERRKKTGNPEDEEDEEDSDADSDADSDDDSEDEEEDSDNSNDDEDRQVPK